MPSTFFGLDIGATGLNIYQTALNTTVHNVANAQTEGYSKQIVNRTASEPISIGQRYGMVGTGVAADKITQNRDAYFDAKYRSANNVYGKLDTKYYYMNTVENYFNDVGNEGGFTTAFNAFWADVEEVEKDPASGSARSQLIHQAASVTDYFNNLSANLTNLQKEINDSLKSNIDQINSYAQQIATLNKQINIIEVNGGFANDLRDQRNLAIDKLSKIANVSVKEEKLTDTDNELPASFNNAKALTVMLNGRYLVNIYNYNTIEAIPRTSGTVTPKIDSIQNARAQFNQMDSEGLYDFAWSDGQDFNLYDSHLGGVLQGLVEMRDGNNLGNFQGTAKTVSKTDSSNAQVIVTNTNINSVDFMNMPSEGEINVAGYLYKYKGFKVDVNENDGTFTYTFTLADNVDIKVPKENANAYIGQSVNYKGIPYYQNKINQFIRTFSRNVNEQHKKGVDLNGELGLDLFNGTDKVSGKNFTFVGPGVLDSDEKTTDYAKSFTSDDETYYKLTTANCTINAAIVADKDKIAAAKKPENDKETPDPGTIAKADVENKDNMDLIEKLKTDSSMFDEGKPSEFFQTLIADIGVDTKDSKTVSENQNLLVKNIEEQRISISGVDTDEEIVDLVKFKQAYNLSAHVITVMNEIYNTLINQMAV